VSAPDALSFFIETHADFGAVGRVLFMHAQPLPSLNTFSGRLTCEQTWKPRADALRAAGIISVKEAEGSYDLILLLPDRQRETILADIARAHDLLADGGTLVVALHNDWGAKRTETLLANIAGNIQSLSKHHSRVFWARKDHPWHAEDLAAWRGAAALRRILDGRFWSAPGLFNWDTVDEGSRLLTEHLPVTLSGAAADLGCGWGYLSDHLLRTCPNIRSLDCYDANATALEAARRNLGLIPSPVRPRLHWHDVTTGLGDVRYDVVVMNPPFHDGREVQHDLGLRFITAAATALRSNTGELWLVANKHLPYENLLRELFDASRTAAEARGFKVLHAAQPKAILHKARRQGRR
jgi:16S rRNA (guanine1207-N2)-methyltransferase